MNYIIVPEDIDAVDDITGEPIYELDDSRTCASCGNPKPEKTGKQMVFRAPTFILTLIRNARFGEDADAVDAQVEIRNAVKKLTETPGMSTDIPADSRWYPFRGLRVLPIEGASMKILAEVAQKPSGGRGQGGYQAFSAGLQRPFIRAILAGKDQEKDPRELAKADIEKSRNGHGKAADDADVISPG